MRSHSRTGVALLLVLSLARIAGAQTKLTPYQQLGRDLLRELVETNTTFLHGNTTRAAEQLAARFRAAGFPAGDVQIVGPDTGRDAKDRNLIVRYRGRGQRRPVLLIGHLDVVEARREDWVRDPFTLVEEDGHFYGRGTFDIKNGVAAWVAALLRMKLEGVVPDGDLVLALTAGEEMGGGYNGIQWLLANRRDLVDAAYALNPDMGSGELRDGRPFVMDVSAAEKVFQTYHLTVRNPGGHSSLPVKDNAIYRLASALTRLGAYEFPLQTNAVTRAYFARMGALDTSALAAAMRAVGATETPDGTAAARLSAHSAWYSALLRTTCVATMVEAGHAVNALPQRAMATVNCRILPGVDPAEIERTLHTVLADSAVVLTRADTAHPSPPSVLTEPVERAIRTAMQGIWGALPIIPTMETAASDGLYLRNAGIPVYGVTGYFVDLNVSADVRAHGLDERISVKGFYEQLEFTYRLLRALDDTRAAL